MTPIRDRLATLDAEHAEARRLVAPIQLTNEARPATAEAILRARLRIDQLPAEIAPLRIAALLAEDELTKATDAARAEVQATIDAERRKVVAHLDKLLTEPAQVNDEVMRLDDLAESRLGAGTARLAFPAVSAETPMGPSMLTCWRDYARANGAL